MSLSIRYLIEGGLLLPVHFPRITSEVSTSAADSQPHQNLDEKEGAENIWLIYG